MARKLLTRAAGNAVLSPLMRVLEHVDDRRANLLRVLTYHDLDPDSGFAEQMELVARRYRVVSAEEVLEALGGGPPLAPRALLITFDDAYRSFETIAWPVLERLGLPAVLFVPSAFPGRPERVFWSA